ncbi:hypothetical protein B7R54_16245 [Subtercola boreus]|uniref:Potassium transporter Trk n=1 Tax=Subtercola boreus TaxID=120213 RepID=A0A3E0VKT9_9MICO|nr:hypothetical protein [Subtercola boreus]RFA10582.1 hypothetical protein B7R54_16245 [Subtercola boreus]
MSDNDRAQSEPTAASGEPVTDVDGVTSVTSTDTVTIHRSPRYYRFMIAGGVAGVIVALVLTFAFPEPPGFNPAQIFGFLGILFVIVGVVVGSVVALVIDRVSRRNARTIDVERSESTEQAD